MTSIPARRWSTLALAGALLTTTPAAIAQLTPEQRLEFLERELERTRQRRQIPGLAFALVRDGQVELVRGFGFSDLETGERVNEQTVFPLGSLTETFSSTLGAIAVSERRVNWDKPISRVFDELTLADPEAARHMSLSTMFAHATGLSDPSILIESPRATREDLFRAASNATLAAPFGSTFIENPVVFTAGVAAIEQVTGQTWADLIQERLATPLGLTHVRTDPNAIIGRPGVAVGYTWNATEETFVRAPAPRVTPILPARGLCASAADMATWSLFCLGRGSLDGQTILPERAFNQTWIPQVEIDDHTSFARGWRVGAFEGQTAFSRSGVFGASTSAMTIVPDEDLAFVVLANAADPTLTHEVRSLVGRALFEDISQSFAASEPTDPTDISGSYHFAKMGVNLIADDQQGDVFLTIPGQGSTILGAPGPDGSRTFAANDSISVRFVRDEQGRVLGMRYRQNGAEHFLPRQGVDEDSPEVGSVGPLSPEAVQGVIGRYRYDLYNGSVQVIRTDDGLAMHIPWEHTHPLVWLGEEGFWAFEDDINVRLKFIDRGDGVASAIDFIVNGADYELTRIPDAPDPGIPSLDDLMALRNSSLGGPLYERVGAIRIDGRVYLENLGVSGPAKALLAGQDRYRLDLSFGRFGSTSSGLDATGAWTASTTGGFNSLDGDALAQARLQHPAVVFQDLRDHFLFVEIVGRTTFKGEPAYIVKASPRDAPVLTLTLSAQTGATLQVEGFTFDLENGSVPVVTTFEDYRDVFGVRMPFRIIEHSPLAGRTLTQYENVRINVPIEDDSFAFVPTE
jgi:CubicO group peptidase (beta-lactamase class C family)